MELGKTGLFMFSRREKTHIFYSIASNTCATQVVGMEDINMAGQEGRLCVVGQVSAVQQRAGPTTLLLLPKEVPLSWQTGPRAAEPLMSGRGQPDVALVKYRRSPCVCEC